MMARLPTVVKQVAVCVVRRSVWLSAPLRAATSSTSHAAAMATATATTTWLRRRALLHLVCPLVSLQVVSAVAAIRLLLSSPSVVLVVLVVVALPQLQPPQLQSRQP
jgi:hypothetical protein